MKHTLTALFAFASLAVSAVEYTATEMRLKSAEKTAWTDMSGFQHHLNLSHSRQSGGKVTFEVAKYTQHGSDPWAFQVSWGEGALPCDYQIGWTVGAIYNDNQLGYVVRVRFNNGLVGCNPTSVDNTMFTLSIRPNGEQYYWHELVVAPPAVGAAWADYKITVYGQWVVGVSIQDYGYSTVNLPSLSSCAWYFN